MRTFDTPKPCVVGHWHIEHPKYDPVTKIQTPGVKRVDRDYEALLWGFGVEGTDNELYCFGLVEKPDGTFDTPSVSVIQLITPTTLSGPTQSETKQPA